MNVAKKDLEWLFAVVNNLMDEEWEWSGQGNGWDDEAQKDFQDTETQLNKLREKYLGKEEI